jgi:hypothetical protein
MTHQAARRRRQEQQPAARRAAGGRDIPTDDSPGSNKEEEKVLRGASSKEESSWGQGHQAARMRKKIDQQHVGAPVGCRDIIFHCERGPYYIHICKNLGRPGKLYYYPLFFLSSLQRKKSITDNSINCFPVGPFCKYVCSKAIPNS